MKAKKQINKETKKIWPLRKRVVKTIFHLGRYKYKKCSSRSAQFTGGPIL